MHRNTLNCIFLLSALLHAGLCSSADNAPSANPHGHRPQGAANAFNVTVPAHPFDLILTRPERNSVTLSVLAYQNMEGFVAYGTQPGTYPMQTPVRAFKKGEPVELILGGLQANTGYCYQFRSRTPGAQPFTSSAAYAFHTARPPGGTFTFTLTADAHLYHIAILNGQTNFERSV